MRDTEKLQFAMDLGLEWVWNPKSKWTCYLTALKSRADALLRWHTRGDDKTLVARRSSRQRRHATLSRARGATARQAAPPKARSLRVQTDLDRQGPDSVRPGPAQGRAGLRRGRLRGRLAGPLGKRASHSETLQATPATLPKPPETPAL